MGCNCGKGKKNNVQYIATDKLGQQHTFKTEIEARAYIARNGGGAVTVKQLARAS